MSLRCHLPLLSPSRCPSYASLNVSFIPAAMLSHPRKPLSCCQADGSLALLQHGTKLYLVDVGLLSSDMFYQLALRRCASKCWGGQGGWTLVQPVQDVVDANGWPP